MSKNVSQHKRMAMGPQVTGMRNGGAVGEQPRKTGVAMNPLTKSKMMNGVPGLKDGGSTKKC